MSSDVTVEMRDDPEWQVVRLDAIVDRELCKLWDECPMSSDRARDEALVGEAIQATIFPVTRRGREHEREIPGRLGLDEAALQCGEQFLGSSDAHEARAADRVAVSDQRDRLIGRDDLVLDHDGRASAVRTVRARCRMAAETSGAELGNRKSSITAICSRSISAGA